jgi:hypothetical protein
MGGMQGQQGFGMQGQGMGMQGGMGMVSESTRNFVFLFHSPASGPTKRHDGRYGHAGRHGHGALGLKIISYFVLLRCAVSGSEHGRNARPARIRHAGPRHGNAGRHAAWNAAPARHGRLSSAAGMQLLVFYIFF